jgi:hypothetical protein
MWAQEKNSHGLLIESAMTVRRKNGGRCTGDWSALDVYNQGSRKATKKITKNMSNL